MRKLNDYIEMAAAEFFQETGKGELDSIWIAEFFQDCGVQDDYPMQGLVAFHALVQKALRSISAEPKSWRVYSRKRKAVLPSGSTRPHAATCAAASQARWFKLELADSV